MSEPFEFTLDTSSCAVPISQRDVSVNIRHKKTQESGKYKIRQAAEGNILLKFLTNNTGHHEIRVSVRILSSSSILSLSGERTSSQRMPAKSFRPKPPRIFSCLDEEYARSADSEPANVSERVDFFALPNCHALSLKSSRIKQIIHVCKNSNFCVRQTVNFLVRWKHPF